MNSTALSLTAASLFALAGALGCSSSSNGTNSTSAVVPKTIEGVCGKLDSLSCARPNCVEQLQLAQSRCTAPSDDFQGMLDCLSVATFTCGGNPPIPQTSQCLEDAHRIDACATGSSPRPSDGNPPADAGDPFACTSVDACTAWPCSCPDGTTVDVAECAAGKCTDPINVCKKTNAAFVSACAGHMGN